MVFTPWRSLGGTCPYHAANIQERHPEAHILVADEDSLDEQGVRHSPRFKPDFNPDLLLSMPYMGRAVCFRRDYFPRLSNEECGRMQITLTGWITRNF